MDANYAPLALGVLRLDAEGAVWTSQGEHDCVRVAEGGKILEVRGVPGTSVDTDRHNGIHETFAATGKKWDVVEVIGKWDDGTAQKVTADAVAVHKKFDGVTVQGDRPGYRRAA